MIQKEWISILDLLLIMQLLRAEDTIPVVYETFSETTTTILHAHTQNKTHMYIYTHMHVPAVVLETMRKPHNVLSHIYSIAQT